MAAGLGTRMRSATPKHLHPLLGRRMVDWVLAAAREAGAEPLVVVASPQTRGRLRRSPASPCKRSRSAPAMPFAQRASGSTSATGDVLVLSGDTPLLTAELLRELVETHRRERAAATVLSFEPPDPRAYGRLVRDGDEPPRAHRRGRRRNARRARAARGQLARSTSSPPRSCGRPSSGSIRTTRRASSTSPTRSRTLVGDGEPVAIHVASDATRG